MRRCYTRSHSELGSQDILVITGGAGFIGSNLISLLLKRTKFKIISIDNYSTGTTKNHILSKRIIYLRGNTIKISSKLEKYKNKIDSIFHFGEFSRIYQSFKYFNQCYESNSIGSKEVFKFCLDNKIKLIYSATSASLGQKGNDKNLSPYAVIGIFEEQYKKKTPLTVVRPGHQTRRFTHIYDTIDICYMAWRKNKCSYYSISHRKPYSIIDVAKMFNSKTRYLPARVGERYASALTNMSFNNKVIKYYGKINLKDYITSFIKSRNNKL